jgi:hypothetical protein
VLAALSASAAGPTAERDRLQCLGTARRDLGLCIKTSRQRCETEFRARLPNCLGGPACPGACVETLDRCEEGPLADRDGCRLACQSDQKVAMQGCRLAEDKPACRDLVRAKAVKCKGRCTRGSETALRACHGAFSGCLSDCAHAK